VTVNNIQALQEDHFGRWKNREAITENLLPIIGQLYRERNIIVQVYSRSLVESFGDSNS
jgi:glyceraldehyde 3-phosphate dehydrogenase